MESKPQDAQKPAFVFFDESVSDTPQALTLMVELASRYKQRQVPLLLMCEAYYKARERIAEAARLAAEGKEKDAFVIFDHLYEAHLQEVSIVLKNTQKHNSSARNILTCIETTYENMRLLLSGVTRLKELSKKTSTLLMDMSSALAAYTVALVMQVRASIPVCIVDALETLPAHFEIGRVYIMLAYSNKKTKSEDNAICHSADTLAAAYAKKAGAQIVDIWTHTQGVMTANATYVENAQVVRTLTYTMALEIAMLGGKIFHPLALQMLMEDKIPIAIYSTTTPHACTTSITPTLENTHISAATRIPVRTPVTVISNQNACSICTISSTDMFHRYGYLEKLFGICSKHGVSVETISTSEISVTISFFTRLWSETFLSDLGNLGEVQCYHDHSLISLISNSLWDCPQKIASVLSSIPQHIAIKTLSLGNAKLSFSFAVQSAQVQQTMQNIHKALYPRL